MAANKRSKLQREKDREQIQQWLFEGISQMKIAEMLNLSRQQIIYDIKVIEENWRKKTALNIDEYKQKKLLEIENSKKIAWEAWHRSINEFKAKTLTARADNDNAVRPHTQVIHTETRVGDPRFLAEVNKLIAEECKLLGLYAPQKQEHTGKDGGPIQIEDQFKGWSKEDVIKYILTGNKPD